MTNRHIHRRWAKGLRAALLRGIASVVACCLLLTSGVVGAHRGHGSWTDVVWVDDRFEITHRIHLADAIELLDRIKEQTSIESMEGLALMAIYVENNFSIANTSKGGALETLGAEIDDDFLYVYQEWLTPLPSGLPQFKSTLLLDLTPDAQAYVHVEAPGINQTLQLGKTSVTPNLQSLRNAPWLQSL